jgi:hypothetical protein
MKLTIVADDGAVGINEEYFFQLDLSQLDPTIHALQWYGEYGEIEFKTLFSNGAFTKPQNQLITDITPFQFVIDAWNVMKAQTVAAAEAAAAAAAEAVATLETPQQEPLQNDGV